MTITSRVSLRKLQNAEYRLPWSENEMQTLYRVYQVSYTFPRQGCILHCTGGQDINMIFSHGQEQLSTVVLLPCFYALQGQSRMKKDKHTSKFHIIRMQLCLSELHLLFWSRRWFGGWRLVMVGLTSKHSTVSLLLRLWGTRRVWGYSCAPGWVSLWSFAPENKRSPSFQPACSLD